MNMVVLSIDVKSVISLSVLGNSWRSTTSRHTPTIVANHVNSVSPLKGLWSTTKRSKRYFIAPIVKSSFATRKLSLVMSIITGLNMICFKSCKYIFFKLSNIRIFWCHAHAQCSAQLKLLKKGGGCLFTQAQPNTRSPKVTCFSGPLRTLTVCFSTFYSLYFLLHHLI